jgi:periplasmic protein CpxP/Spy
MKTIVAVLASTFLITCAYAQSPARPAGAPSSPDASTSAMMKSDAKRDMEVEKHIKDLHAKLKITPAEESQWTSVAQTMRDNAKEVDNAINKREAIVNSATAVEDLNAYGDIAQAHADGVKKLSTAFSPLYASMSDDQKQVADEVFGHRTHEGKKISKATK